MEGIANYVDLTDGVSVREVADEATGIISREVIESKQTGKSANLRPRITMRDANGEVLNLSNGNEACLLYTSPSPRDQRGSRMPSSA